MSCWAVHSETAERINCDSFQVSFRLRNERDINQHEIVFFDNPKTFIKSNSHFIRFFYERNI